MILAPVKMVPDSTMTYIENACRLDRVDVKEAIVRPIHQRRPTIATVTDTLRVILSTHPGITRPGTTEPYGPTFGCEIKAAAAKATPKVMLVTCQAQRGDHVPMEAASNIICVAVSVKRFNTDDLDDQSTYRKYDNPPVVHENHIKSPNLNDSK